MPRPTKAMRDRAAWGLEMRRKHKRGGTAVGVNTARLIVANTDFSLRMVVKIGNYFPRHEVDKKAKGYRPGEKGYPSAGVIAAALWGGEPAKAWARKHK